MSIKRFFREDLVNKIVKSEIRLALPAGGANIDPPIGPTLSQFGVNATEFCTRFNQLTAPFGEGSVYLTATVKKVDRDFFIKLSGPTVASLIMRSSIVVSTATGLRYHYIFLSDMLRIAKFFYAFDRASIQPRFLRSYLRVIYGSSLGLGISIIIN